MLFRSRDWTTAARLTLHPTKTRLVDSRSEKFAFLGYYFRGTKHWPRDKSREKLKETLRAKTKRSTGQSLKCIIQDVNQTLVGWLAYFKHSSYANVFNDHDEWLRGRLRSILRKRAGGRGRGRGSDHQKWTILFFVKHGLFNLKNAHALAVQSSRR